ncbi:MAG: hypothetical protein AAFY45_20425 [Bacteroidota bacterium]
MTDKQSIADWIGLLYQERKLIDFILLQSRERLLFSKEELLPFCRNNPERFQRLLDQNFLQEKGGNFAASVVLIEFSGSNEIAFSLDAYIQEISDRLQNLQQGNDRHISEWKRCLYQVEEVFLIKAEELSVERNQKEVNHFQQQIRELRIILLDEKLAGIISEEVEILYLELRQGLKELEQSMNRISQGIEIPFNQKLRSIKNQKELTSKKEVQELMKNQHAFFLDQTLQIKPRISSTDLEAEEALYTLAKNVR